MRVATNFVLRRLAQSQYGHKGRQHLAEARRGGGLEFVRPPDMLADLGDIPAPYYEQVFKAKICRPKLDVISKSVIMARARVKCVWMGQHA